ncbi:PH domain-like protein, partial [Testicularia cyperi]
RKREREGSLEPTAQATPTKRLDTVPAKKNRLQDSVEEEEDSAEARPETEKVGQIRKKVDELSTEESLSNGSAVESLGQSDSKLAATEKHAKHDSTQADTPDQDTASEATPAAEDKETGTAKEGAAVAVPARTQPTFASFSSKTSPFSAIPSSSGTSGNSGSLKPGFAAFSSKASPLSPSPAAASPGGGIKPSSLGSAIGGHHKDKTAGPSNLSAPVKPAVKGQAFGFGAFAGASPLSKPKPVDSKESEATSTGTGLTAAKESFAQKLLSEDSGTVPRAQQKSKPILEAPEDSKTGEEDEETIHSIRAKLYTMSEDQSWKERGTGTLRVNVPKTSTGKRSARLVMRADGILRVILNVSLFQGMKCELAEKFVRIVAFEDAKPVHYAIKMSNPNNAAALMDVLDDFV